MNKKYKKKSKMIGALIAVLGNRAISAVTLFCGCCWGFAKKSYDLFVGTLPLETNAETRGKKSLEEKFPDLKDDITNIIENHSMADRKINFKRNKITIDFYF